MLSVFQANCVDYTSCRSKSPLPHPQALMELRSDLSQRARLLPPPPTHTLSTPPTPQEAGQFVVTFPAATTSNFNTGFNLVESVSAAPPDWWSWAEAAAARLRASRRVPVRHQGPTHTAQHPSVFKHRWFTTSHCLKCHSRVSGQHACIWCNCPAVRC